MICDTTDDTHLWCMQRFFWETMAKLKPINKSRKYTKVTVSFATRKSIATELNKRVKQCTLRIVVNAFNRQAGTTICTNQNFFPHFGARDSWMEGPAFRQYLINHAVDPSTNNMIRHLGSFMVQTYLLGIDPQVLLLMVQKSGEHQLSLVVYPTILEGFTTIPGGWEWDFWTIKDALHQDPGQHTPHLFAHHGSWMKPSTGNHLGGGSEVPILGNRNAELHWVSKWNSCETCFFFVLEIRTQEGETWKQSLETLEVNEEFVIQVRCPAQDTKENLPKSLKTIVQICA